ncbi:hypothetical protein [Arundinibacter roseus]|uniref:hypothetical protein n=1 Tax=Arundinibacter roseus TaxID=2070510 RepID=UPI001404A750|nr:hypothetical protein [Arundinibacter roseus]
MNAYTTNTPVAFALKNSKKSYHKPSLVHRGTVARLTLKAGSSTDAFTNFTP